MSAWIESHQTLRQHPKTRRLARSVGSLAAAIGHLHCLWWWCMDYAPDGDLTRFDNSDVADGAEWEGEPDEFMTALVDAGFITADRKVHDWQDYAGRLIEKREANALRNRKWRARNKHEDDASASRDAHVMRTQRGSDALPNRTEPNHTKSTPPSLKGSPPTTDLFLTTFWPHWPHRKGSKQLAGKRFAALTAPQQERCLAAEEHIIAALEADMLEPQFLPRAENFIGGSKCYYREWADGIPEHLTASGNGTRRAPRRGLDSAIDTLQAVYDGLPDQESP